MEPESTEINDYYDEKYAFFDETDDYEPHGE
jgi:hypothetical protein